MDVKPACRVFMGDDWGFVDTPVIVTTLYLNRFEDPTGEWFLIIPDLAGIKLVSQRITLTSSFPSGPVAFTETEFLAELLRQAKHALRNHILATRGQDANALLAQRRDITESNTNLFVSLWMNGGYEDILAKIAGTTGLGSLRELLGWIITELPKFTINPL